MIKITEVPSPFCGIGSDDLTVQVKGVTLKVTENGCRINTPAFEQAITQTSPRVQGKEVSLKVAVEHTGEILKRANQPVIGGCATDVAGMRALLALADRSGAVVDSSGFSADKNNFLAMQTSGWMNTTLAEIKNRCDLLLIIGCDLETFAPRFFSSYLWNTNSLFIENTSTRQVIYIGKAPSGNASTSPNNTKAQVLECSNTDLPEVVAVLRALIKNRTIMTNQVGGLAVADLQKIADKLKKSSYGVVVWDAATLAFAQAELTIQSICQLVKDVNICGTRCSGFPLGGKEGGQTANQVCGWQTGYPARISFSSAIPKYDPWLYNSKQMLDNDEVDAFVWVQAFNVNVLPPAIKTQKQTKQIVVARSGMVFVNEPEVFIPIGTPGIDHSGYTYRLDNVVAIRLKKLRTSGLPSTAQVLSSIEQAL